MENPSPGCGNAKITSCVCAMKPECCTNKWTTACVDLAKVCGTPCLSSGPPSACCDVTEGAVGCAADDVCEDCVCDLLPYCCDLAWDEECVKCGAGQGAVPIKKHPARMPVSAPTFPKHTIPVVKTGQHLVAGTPRARPAYAKWNPPVVMWPGTAIAIPQPWDSVMRVAGASLRGPCCEANDSPGCGDIGCEGCICDIAPECCSGPWTEACAAIGANACKAVRM